MTLTTTLLTNLQLLTLFKTADDMENSLGELLTSTIITLLIALPIIVDEVNKRIKKLKKGFNKKKIKKIRGI